MNENHMDDTFQQQQGEDYSQLKEDLNSDLERKAGGTEVSGVVFKSEDFKSQIARPGQVERKKEFMEHGITDDREEMQVLEGLGP